MQNLVDKAAEYVGREEKEWQSYQFITV